MAGEIVGEVRMTGSSEGFGPLPCTPAAARDAIDSARRKVMDLYGGNLDHPALDHLEAALCAVEDIERDRSLAPAPRSPDA